MCVSLWVSQSHHGTAAPGVFVFCLFFFFIASFQCCRSLDCSFIKTQRRPVRLWGKDWVKWDQDSERVVQRWRPISSTKHYKWETLVSHMTCCCFVCFCFLILPFVPEIHYILSKDRSFIFNSSWKLFARPAAAAAAASVMCWCKSWKKRKHFLSLRSHAGELHRPCPSAAVVLVWKSPC